MLPAGQTCSGAFSQPSLERQSGQRRDPGTGGDRFSEGQCSWKAFSLVQRLPPHSVFPTCPAGAPLIRVQLRGEGGSGCDLLGRDQGQRLGESRRESGAEAEGEMEKGLLRQA